MPELAHGACIQRKKRGKHHAVRSVRATLEFGPLRNLVAPVSIPSGAPNQVRIRLRTGDQFQVLQASRAA